MEGDILLLRRDVLTEEDAKMKGKEKEKNSSVGGEKSCGWAAGAEVSQIHERRRI